MPKLEPTFDNVVILRDTVEGRSEGGIILPDSVKKGKAMRGKIVSVGPGKKDVLGVLEPVTVKKGDTVCFGAFSGHEVVMDTKTTYVVMPFSEILGTLKD